MEIQELNDFIHEQLTDMKAVDILNIDVSEKSTITDTMFIATGNSSRHVKAIADNVALAAKEAGIPPLGVEGEQGSNWVLVDLGDAIVHVMLAETRDFYNLEKLWGGPVVDVDMANKKSS